MLIGMISPWSTSRSATPQPTANRPDRQHVLQQSKGEDHIVTHTHRINLCLYPEDCPPLKVKWFYAVDSPKRKPMLSDCTKQNTKPLPLPKKFVPFSGKDSQAIETAFQKISKTEVEFEQQKARFFIFNC